MTQVDGFKEVDVAAVVAKVKKMRDAGELQLGAMQREGLDRVLESIEKGESFPEDSRGMSLLLMCADGIYSQ